MHIPPKICFYFRSAVHCTQPKPHQKDSNISLIFLPLSIIVMVSSLIYGRRRRHILKWLPNCVAPPTIPILGNALLVISQKFL